MITIRQKGDFANLANYLRKSSKFNKNAILTKYGELGVEALRAATPVDSGLTADSWYYEIDNSRTGGDSIVFKNSNINEDVNIAVILQYGHGTGTGGWVEGIDYINPALRPIFEQLVQDAWEEVIKI